jgi:hypothetical protein
MTVTLVALMVVTMVAKMAE